MKKFIRILILILLICIGVMYIQQNNFVNNSEDNMAYIYITALDSFIPFSKGLNTETLSLEGFLLKVDYLNFKFYKQVVIVSSKFRGGDATIGVKCIIVYTDGKW